MKKLVILALIEDMHMALSVKTSLKIIIPNPWGVVGVASPAIPWGTGDICTQYYICNRVLKNIYLFAL